MVIVIRYGVNWLITKRESEELKALYYSSENEPVVTDEISIETSSEPINQKGKDSKPTRPASLTRPSSTQVPSPLPVGYPRNPYHSISPKIKRLQRENQDIIGWLHIDNMLDEAIVQKDNSYYLRRDYKGYHNANGALFLEQSCNLKNRPFLYMIYGHNMKTGAMFGSLRNWENQSFYRSNPFIHFETMYEEGDYVIFSIGTFTEKALYNGFLIYTAADLSIARQKTGELLKALEYYSLYTNHIQVSDDDQLLLLITCDGKDNERRVVAARRVREGEHLEELQVAIQRQRKKGY